MKTRITQTQRSIVVFHLYQHQQTQAAKLVAAWRQFWQRRLGTLKTSTDPTVWQTIDSCGTVWWHAYHPLTSCRATRESELEILAWIEQGQ